MQYVEVELFGEQYNFESPPNIHGLHYEWGNLVVTLMCVDDRKAAKIKFSEVLGFRLLDEGNLLEFWEFCKGGWIFLVKKNGWFDLEATRAGFLLDRNLKLSEFFIAGENDCLSIISGENPVIEIFSI